MTPNACAGLPGKRPTAPLRTGDDLTAVLMLDLTDTIARDLTAVLVVDLTDALARDLTAVLARDLTAVLVLGLAAALVLVLDDCRGRQIYSVLDPGELSAARWS